MKKMKKKMKYVETVIQLLILKLKMDIDGVVNVVKIMVFLLILHLN